MPLYDEEEFAEKAQPAEAIGHDESLGGDSANHAAQPNGWSERIRALKEGETGAVAGDEQADAGDKSDSKTEGKEALSEKESGGADKQDAQPKKQQKSFAERFKGKSKLGKRLGVATALGGGSIIGAMVLFLLMLPLKIEHIITNLESYYAAAPQRAVGKVTDELINDYIKDEVLPSLGSQGRCHSTVTPGCVTVTSATGPVGQVYQAWRKNSLETKMAANHGLIFSRSGPNYFMTVNGHNVDLSQVRSGAVSVFDLPGTSQVSKSEIRQAVRDATKTETFWVRSYHRFVYGRYLERQIGIKRCIIICKLGVTNKIKSSFADRKLAAKAYLLQRIVPEKYAVIMQCVLLGGCDDTLKPAHPGEEARLTEGQTQIRTALTDAARHFIDKDLEELAKLSREIADKGFMSVVAREIAKTIATKLFDAAAGEASGKIAEKAVPVIGWVVLIAELLSLADHIGPMVQHMAYAANIASAIEMANAYSTVASEMKTGNADPIQLASFSDTLSTNLSGSKDDQQDATQSRYYNYVVNGTPPGGASTSAAISPASLIFGTAHAAIAPKIKCADDSNIPDGKIVCPEEKLDIGNGALSAISGFIDKIPLLPTLADAISKVASVFGEAVGWFFDGACGAIPGCKDGLKQIGEWVAPLFAKIQEWIIPTPFTKNMSGVRTVDMIGAGLDGGHSQTSRDVLGAPRASPALMASIRNDAKAERVSEFQHMNMFARMFDTNNSYSLISRLAVSMPTNLNVVATNQMASFLGNPLGQLASILGSAFRPASAFAAGVDDPNQPDPFGIPQFAYKDIQIPPHPGQFWKDNNCDDPNQVSDWMNHGTQDPNTGEMTSDTPNPCMLIKSSAISNAAAFDPTILPPGGSGDQAQQQTASTGGAGTSIPTGDTIALAQQIKSNPNITFQTPAEAAAFDHIVATGHATECGAPVISPTLLGVILKLSESYQLVLGVFDDGHNGPSGTKCDGGFHPKGSAVDINGINPINGGAGTGRHVTFAAGEQATIRQFYQTAGEILAANGGGGLGQYGTNSDGSICFSGAMPPKVGGVTYFADSCDHVHMDTRGH